MIKLLNLRARAPTPTPTYHWIRPLPDFEPCIFFRAALRSTAKMTLTQLKKNKQKNQKKAVKRQTKGKKSTLFRNKRKKPTVKLEGQPPKKKTAGNSEIQCECLLQIQFYLFPCHHSEKSNTLQEIPAPTKPQRAPKPKPPANKKSQKRISYTSRLKPHGTCPKNLFTEEAFTTEEVRPKLMHLIPLLIVAYRHPVLLRAPSVVLCPNLMAPSAPPFSCPNLKNPGYRSLT